MARCFSFRWWSNKTRWKTHFKQNDFRTEFRFCASVALLVHSILCPPGKSKEKKKKKKREIEKGMKTRNGEKNRKRNDRRRIIREQENENVMSRDIVCWKKMLKFRRWALRARLGGWWGGEGYSGRKGEGRQETTTTTCFN